METTEVVTKAMHKGAMISPQKCRLVADLIRGKNVDVAFRVLTLEKKKAANILMKVVKSAVANADQKGTVNLDRLFISKLWIEKGPSRKKHMPRAQGKADINVTRTSHVILEMSERKPVKKAASKTTKTAKKTTKKKVTKKTTKKSSTKKVTKKAGAK